ncbi:hypothetical protein IFM89_008942 [Coptis chinensis]|uniref:Uncharacterized protein n=1 Tax=Coptis chinensis TaxID=261450 RepID=A0A835I9X5_9MAGN|nr:hypothetical protein IFM89_008942 [Coptis chinensis]
MEIYVGGFAINKADSNVLARDSLPPNPAQSTESKVLAQVYWWLYDQTLKTGHVADLTVRVYGRGLSINLSTYQLLRQYQWLNHEVISVCMTLLDRRYNRLARYDDFVTIREPSKYYAIIPDTQILVDLQRIARRKHKHPVRHQVQGVDDGLQFLKPPLDTGRLLLPHLDLPDL